MKITKLVTVETEVEVGISAEDIAAVLAEEPVTSRQALIAINNAAAVIKGLSLEMIEAMGEPARKTIAAFFAEQAERFSADEPVPSAEQGRLIGGLPPTVKMTRDEVRVIEDLAWMVKKSKQNVGRRMLDYADSAICILKRKKSENAEARHGAKDAASD